MPDRTLVPADATATAVMINVDGAARYQGVLGMGGTLDSSSVWNLAHMSPANRDRVMRALFHPQNGNATNLVRLPMGCSDACSQAFYTFDDMPAGGSDPGLTRFSIQKDLDSGIIAVARQALAINPGVRFYMSMWSAPAWMKDNGSLIDGGSVRPEHYGALARYQRMAIQAYQAQGVPIHAMTPQNEPLVVNSYPTGQWTGAQMRDYIKSHLGPELRGHGLSTEIWIGDDNPPSLTTFVPAILDDPAARAFVSAVAVHDYTSDAPTVLEAFRIRYPDVPVHLTERSYYGVDGRARRDDGTVQAGVRRLIGFLRSGIVSWTWWMTFLDDAGEPYAGPLPTTCCDTQFMAPPGNPDAVRATIDHFLYGHLSKWVRHGAVRIGSDQTSTEVSNVAFRNPDGTVVVVVANGADAARSVKVSSSDGVFTDTLPAKGVATYRWAGGPVVTDARDGTWRIVNRHDPSLALQITRETYGGFADAYQVAATPVAWNDLEQRWTITYAGDGHYRVTSNARPAVVLHNTGDRYGPFTGVHSVAATPGAWLGDEQLWRIVDVGGGHYRFVNKTHGTVLQATGERYGPYTDVYRAAASPDAWNLAEQQWKLLPG
jgi:glucosylceramidase